MRKSLGNKRKEIQDTQIEEISKIYNDFKESEICKIFDNDDFGFRKVTVERPLKLKFQVNQEKGLPCYGIHVTSQINQVGYEDLVTRINMGTIVYPPHHTLLNELQFLCRKQTGKSVRYEASVNSTDDLTDRIARLCYVANTEFRRTIKIGW